MAHATRRSPRVLGGVLAACIAAGACATQGPEEGAGQGQAPDPPAAGAAQDPHEPLGPRMDLLDERPAAVPPAAAPAGPSAAVDNETLEERVGSMPAPPQVIVPAGYRDPKLPGKPGPSPAMGPNHAKVKVFVWSDFQCPVCRRAVEPMKLLVRSHPNDVQVIFKHNALDIHRRAAAAAAASIAAFKQGKFWELHDRVFADQGSLGDDDLEGHARALGLDMDRFRKDREAPATKDQMAYERAVAGALDAASTPSFFVNGQKQVGWGSYSGIEQMVQAALAAVRSRAPEKLAPGDVAKEATRAAGPDGELLARLLWGPASKSRAAARP